jgi:hypothetical protein
MPDYYEKLEKAPALKDLKSRIEEAIAICGEDAPWNGWDDGSLCIHPPGRRWVQIFPE